MKTQLGLWLFLFLLGFANMIVGDLTLDFQLFTHDFSESYGGNDTRLTRFIYHMDLFITPAVLCGIVLLPRQKMLQPLWAMTLIWYIKGIGDVIICNNNCETFWLDNICYICMVILAYWGWIHKIFIVWLKRIRQVTVGTNGNAKY